MDLDLALKLADLDLADAGLDTSLIFDAYNA